MHECPLYGKYCKEKCILRSEFDHQAENGSNRIKGDRSSGAGKYWEKEAWNLYVNNVKKVAKEGCLNEQELIAHIDIVTLEKEQKGELY